MPAGSGDPYDRYAPIVAPRQRWMREAGLIGDDPAFEFRPTMELRWRGKVLEQMWIISEMAYTHKWVPVRRKSKEETR